MCFNLERLKNLMKEKKGEGKQNGIEINLSVCSGNKIKMHTFFGNRVEEC